MKIVLAVHHFPPHRSAGAELQAYRTAASLQARGHDIRVVCIDSITAEMGPGVAWDDDVYQGLPVRRLRCNLAAAPDPDRWEYDNLWIGDHLQKLLLQERPDIFHLYGGYLISGRSLCVAKQLGIATVVSLMDFWFLCRHLTLMRSDHTLSGLPLDPVACAQCIGEEQRRYRLPAQIAPGLMRAFWRLRRNKVRQAAERMEFMHKALMNADLIIAQSRFVESMYVEAGIPQERIVFCRQGQDLPGPQVAPISHSHSATLRLGFMGQIAWHKGVHVLVQAIRNLPDANLVAHIYGNDKQNQSYRSQLAALAQDDPRIRFDGSFRHDQIGDIFAALDALVVPSVWYENSPNTIFEAFAYHTPVLASNLGGMAELVQHEQNGLLFSKDNADELAQQIQRLLAEPELLAKLRAGIEPVKRLEQETDELETLFATLIHTDKLNLSRS